MIYWIFFVAIVVMVVLLWMKKPRGVAVLTTPPSVPPAELPVHNGLLQFYKPAQEVKLDFPPKKIGCCPFSKPMSQALPPADVPMCMAAAGKKELKL